MKRHAFFEHTADVGLEAEGGTPEELFSAAAEGLFAYLFAAPPGPADRRQTIRLDAADRETLLVAWLNELIYLVAAKRLRLTAFSFRTLTGEALEAEVAGYHLPPGENPVREIKAATYHELRIERSEGGLRAHVIFDV